MLLLLRHPTSKSVKQLLSARREGEEHGAPGRDARLDQAGGGSDAADRLVSLDIVGRAALRDVPEPRDLKPKRGRASFKVRTCLHGISR